MKMSAISFNDSFSYKDTMKLQNSMNENAIGTETNDVRRLEQAGKDVAGIGGHEECQTCANRKYVDGSNEMDVSFKAPGHISPESSKAQVSAHEQMHVANARAEGSKENKELVSASVRIKMARCPECGVSYAAGGETTTVIRTTTPNYDANNPYAQRQKAIDGQRLAGANIQATF